MYESIYSKKLPGKKGVEKPCEDIGGPLEIGVVCLWGGEGKSLGFPVY